MAPTFLLYLQKNNVQLTIIIGKDGTPSYCKARLIMLVDLSMCMWVGLDEYMMPVFFQTPAFIVKDKVIVYFQVYRNRLPVERFHLLSLVTQRTLC